MAKEIIFCVDMQGGYKREFDGSFTQACADINAHTLKSARRGIETWMVYYGSPQFDGVILDAATPPARRRDILWQFHSDRGGGLAEFIDHRDKTIVFKTDFDAFQNPNLDDALMRAEVGKINLVGYSRPSCIRVNAMAAAARGYDTTIVKDLTFHSRTYGEAHRFDDVEGEIRKRLKMELLSCAYGIEEDHAPPPLPALYETYRTRALTPEECERARLELVTIRARSVLADFAIQEALLGLRRSGHPLYRAMESIKIVGSGEALGPLPPQQRRIAGPRLASERCFDRPR
jgi:nicotinamidase-related amidase